MVKPQMKKSNPQNYAYWNRENFKNVVEMNPKQIGQDGTGLKKLDETGWDGKGRVQKNRTGRDGH